MKDTFTQEDESCYKTEKIIDDKLHELKIQHKFQVRFKQINCIADWVLFINDKKIIMEYFGVSVRQDKIGERYRKRMIKKIAFYETLIPEYELIQVFPHNLDVKLGELEKLITN